MRESRCGDRWLRGHWRCACAVYDVVWGLSVVDASRSMSQPTLDTCRYVVIRSRSQTLHFFWPQGCSLLISATARKAHYPLNLTITLTKTPNPLTLTLILTQTPNLVEQHLTCRYVGVSKLFPWLVIWWAINDTLKLCLSVCVGSCLPRYCLVSRFILQVVVSILSKMWTSKQTLSVGLVTSHKSRSVDSTIKILRTSGYRKFLRVPPIPPQGGAGIRIPDQGSVS